MDRELRSRVKYISGENRSVLFDVPAEGKGEFLTTAQISQKLIDFGSIKRSMPLNRLGMILGQQGYKCVRRGPQKQRGWLVYQRSTEESISTRRPMPHNRKKVPVPPVPPDF